MVIKSADPMTINIVFDCKVDHFDLLIPSIKSVHPHLDGIRVVSGRSSYDLITYMTAAI